MTAATHERALAPTLALRDVTISYRTPKWFGSTRVCAVHEVSLELDPGRVVALVGESGCGKSSIARAIVGLTTVESGEIRLGDTSLAGRRNGARRRVQMIFQNPRASLNPRRTVRAALVEALAAGDGPSPGAGEPGAELRDLLASVSLPAAMLDRFPRQMSGGQCQRVAIARALAISPQFLLADEATASLDASVAAGTVSLFRRLADERGLGVLLITHDLRTVEWIADEVAVMYLGRIVEQGSVADVLGSPRHPYTACLLDARPALQVRNRPPIRARGEVADSATTGCAFAPRCPMVSDRCRSVAPEPSTAPHRVACHHPLDDDSLGVTELKEPHAHRSVGP